MGRFMAVVVGLVAAAVAVQGQISFTDIGSGIRKPGVYAEFNLAAARVSLPANDSKALILAQRIAEPSAWVGNTATTVGTRIKPVTTNGHWYICITAGTTKVSTQPTWPTVAGDTVADSTVTWMEWVSCGSMVAALTPTAVYSDADAALYFGAGSPAHLMAAAAFRANRELALTVLPISDANGSAYAVGSVKPGGTAATSGVLTLDIGNVPVSVAITSGQSATTIARALRNAINTSKSLLPVTADVADSTVSLRAKCAGSLGNQVGLYTRSTATGTTYTIVQPTGGATDPDLAATSGALATVFAGEYTHYSTPYLDADNCGDLKTHLDNISGGTEMRPATAWLGYTDEIGVIDSAKSRCGAAGATLNHWRVSVGYLPGTYSLPYEVGAAYMAMAAKQNDPAGPLNGLTLAGIDPPDIGSRLSRTVQETLLDNGVTPLEVISGEQVAIVRAISTYTRNAQGIEDPTRLDMTTATALDYVRKACRQRVSIRFPRPKLTDRFKKDLRSELLDVLVGCERLEVTQDIATWKDYLLIETDLQDNTRVNARIPASIVRGAHVIALRLDLL